MTSQIPLSGLKQQVSVTDGNSNNPSISFSNDTNTGLYRAAEDTLAITTGGVERLRIDANGNVRVPYLAALLFGETNGPNQPPSTDGVRIYTSNVVGNSDYLVVEKTDGNNATPDGGFLFQGRGSGNVPAEYMRIKPISATTAYVGIGTTDPTTHFHVANTLRTGFLTVDALDGTAPTRAAPSAKYLKDTFGYTTNGVYWIKPSSTPFPFLTYCDFTTEGGGWTCVRSTVFENRDSTNAVYFSGLTTSTGYPNFNPELFILRTSFMSAVKAGTYPEFLMYISNDGTFDAHSANNYCVVKPTTATQDFLQGTGNGLGGIPTYGKIRGYNIGSGGLGSGYTVSWWYNQSSQEPHINTPSASIPNSVSSEDAFGFFNGLNTSHYNTGQYHLRFIR